MATVTTGLQQLIDSPPASVRGKRLGLLCNSASIDTNYRHARDLVHTAFPGLLAALFSPQHGFYAEKQDNMIESDDIIDPGLKIPIFSLYGETRVPTMEMMECIDVLVVDLQDVGTRVYTFLTTLSYCMEQAARAGRHVVVLDRPNPVSGCRVEGNCLSTDYYSFVGRYPIPMRHGLTIGEYASFINAEFNMGCSLEIIPMNGWRRNMYFTDTGLPWVPPSPNLPTPASANVYPGQVIWEGTNISEGRGTTLPFEMFGAPFLDTDKILSYVKKEGIAGCILRPVIFEPTAHKWQGKPCRGFHIHITEPDQYDSYTTSLALLQAILHHHRDCFQWKPPPYEYEEEKLPFDLITGDDRIRRQLEAFETVAAIRENWHEQTADFISRVRSHHLYD
jgi:uncharacterized protein YbbC (DUF1343 family)